MKKIRFSCFTTICIVLIKTLQAQHVPLSYPENALTNYIKTWTATSPVSDVNLLSNLPLSGAKQSIDYFDGLGRHIQKVEKEGSMVSGNAPTDLVTANEYDFFGMETYSWLPFPSTENNGLLKTAPFIQQSAFMNAQYAAQGEKYFYGQTDFELSPLGRPIKQYSSGNSWVGNKVGTESKYWLNTKNDDVKQWDINESGLLSVFASYSTVKSYPAGQLYKEIMTDENGYQSIEFKDKEGHIVLKKRQLTAKADDGNGTGYDGWTSVYNIYDDLGNLRCIVQPVGVEMLNKNGWNLSDTTVLNEQCFRYEYDERYRMTMKKVPGAGEVYMVYDARDRLVMKQDGNMRQTDNWFITAYDNIDRPIQMGMNHNSTSFYEHNTNAKNNTNYPGAIDDLFTQTHYDDYEGLPLLSPEYNNKCDDNFDASNNAAWPFQQVPIQNKAIAKGMVTWSTSKVLGTSKYLPTVNIYDDHGRLVQYSSINITGGTDVNTTQYNWTGQPLTQVRLNQNLQINAGTTIAVEKKDYDFLGRPVQIQDKLSNSMVNNGSMTAFKIISTYQYDALGRLKRKIFEPNYSSNSSLDSSSYDYNIRGWLLGVNRDYVQDVSTTDPSSDGERFTTPLTYGAGNYFGFDLGYDKDGIIGTYNHLLDGNIAGCTWKSAHDGQIRKYDFAYDAEKRLKESSFNQFTDNGFSRSAGIDFSSSNLGYDANGNITGMKQMGLIGNTSAPIDQLKYNYASGSNKLMQIIDTANNVSSELGDFKYDPSTKTEADFTYDANGNTSSDANKKINGISYNHLNLPEQITVAGKGTINYLYDASGNKLQKAITEGGQTATTTYLGNLVYRNDTLQYVTIAEGRVRPDVSTNSFVFDYFLKDQLGNTRMTLTDDPAIANHILDATSFYPFGLSMEGISYKTEGFLKNNIKYNGKELQHSEFNDNSGLEWYDYGARFQDPQIGRMLQQDPMAENYSGLTPFNYVSNNPINGIDPDGRDVIFINATSGALGAGHAAVIIGNANDGWFYYSLNGTGNQRPYGDSKDPDVGTPLGYEKNINQLIIGANTVNPNETHDYDRYIIVKTTQEEDRTMKIKATKAASVKKYIVAVAGQACIDVDKAVYSSLVDGRVGYWHNYLDWASRYDPMPNSWFENLPTTFKSLNDFMHTWNVGNKNYFQAPIKPKPVIIVDPIESKGF